MSVELSSPPTHRVTSPPDGAAATLAGVLAEIAETAAETLELQEVFHRVATAIRRLIPLDNMGVVRILDGRYAVLHATTVPCGDGRDDCTEPEPLSSWSPRLRPRQAPIARVDDALEELDPNFPLDASILAGGVRSALWEPFHLAGSFTGGVWISSYRPHAFQNEHQEVLRPIAALLGSAVEHWRIWDAERRRRERLDRLETVLGPLAESLDVRAVFERISEGAQAVLPHHLLVLTEPADESAPPASGAHAGAPLRTDAAAPRAMRIAAVAGQSDAPVPLGPVPLADGDPGDRLPEYELYHDVRVDLPPTSECNRSVAATGMRSWLRVPIRLWGEVRGSLVFMHREPARYVEADVEVASRLADRIALAICHHRLSAQAQAAAEARERAERLEATVASLTRELEGKARVVGISRSWKEVLLQVGRVASSETTVLITGESGTGKEIVSRLIRQGSPRADKPFVAVNCAALPEQLLESELFGHEKGAFTGAYATKIGRLEQAAGGTLFLDEVGEMSPLVQAKLLRVLQEREFQRVGGTRVLRADVRLIAATNRDLQVSIARGGFREDLYYRLNVFEIGIPPLRDRPEDILPLAESFLEELRGIMGRPAGGISRDARDWLLAYHWPGNVRELRNAIERGILLCDGGLITREHLPAAIGRPEPARGANGSGAALGREPLAREAPLPAGVIDLEDVERDLVERALRDTRGNKSRAARLLGITRAQLYSRIEKYSLDA